MSAGSFGFSVNSVIRPRPLTFITPNSGAWAAVTGVTAMLMLGSRREVRLGELPVVHPIKMVAGEDQDEVAHVLDEAEVLADGVGRALVPVPVLEGLLGREEGDEVLVEIVEAVGRENVAMERFARELGQDEDLPEVGVDAVADRDVDEPEPAGDRDGRLAPDLGQRVEPAALPPRQDDGDDVGHGCTSGPGM